MLRLPDTREPATPAKEEPPAPSGQEGDAGRPKNCGGDSGEDLTGHRLINHDCKIDESPQRGTPGGPRVTWGQARGGLGPTAILSLVTGSPRLLLSHGGEVGAPQLSCCQDTRPSAHNNLQEERFNSACVLRQRSPWSAGSRHEGPVDTLGAVGAPDSGKLLTSWQLGQRGLGRDRSTPSQAWLLTSASCKHINA